MGTAKILVIDDEQSLLEVLEIVLGRSGYEVRTAATEEAGYAAFREFKPDLVLLDINLGGELDGLEVCKRIRAREHPPEVIFLNKACSPLATHGMSSPRPIIRFRLIAAMSA